MPWTKTPEFGSVISSCQTVEQHTGETEPISNLISTSSFLANEDSDADLGIAMMAVHSGIERSEQMWIDLAAKTGVLRVSQFYHAKIGKGVIELVKTDQS